MSDATATAEPRGFQFASARHGRDTSVAGMWLFLATELLFFGGLWLAWLYARHSNMAGFDAGSRSTDLLIGTVNSVVLFTSGVTFSAAVAAAEVGRARLLLRMTQVTFALGLAFLVLKGIEWADDFDQNLFPGGHFAIQGEIARGAKLFYSFYFVSTGLHGVHILVGLGLLAWVMRGARRGWLTGPASTTVEAIGLYWGFVDIVWIVLYPLIYLIGR